MAMAAPAGAGAPSALLPFVMLFFLRLTVNSSPLPPDAKQHQGHISLAPSLSLSLLPSSSSLSPPPESPALSSPSPTSKSSPLLRSSSRLQSSPGRPVLAPVPPSAFSPEPAAADDLISGRDTTNGAGGGGCRMSGAKKAGIAFGVLAAAVAVAAVLVWVCLKRRRNERLSAYTSTAPYEIF